MNRDQVKGAALRAAALRASDQGGRADPADETVINGAPYDPADETVINGAPYHPTKAMSGAAAVAGRAAYRAEYMRVHGRDVDEWLDGPNPDRN
jgi:hypothetical protein